MLKPTLPTVREISKSICDKYGITQEELWSRLQGGAFAEARRELIVKSIAIGHQQSHIAGCLNRHSSTISKIMVTAYKHGIYDNE